MTRLSILVGIALMLVGAVAYVLPENPQASALIPPMGGLIMALGGLMAARNDHLRKHVMHVNVLVSIVLLIWVSSKVGTDLGLINTDKNAITTLIADVDILALSAIYLYFAIRSFIKARMTPKTTESSPEESLAKMHK